MRKQKNNYALWLMAIMLWCGFMRAQAPPPPLVYTNLGSGTQTLTNDTIIGGEKWYVWTADTGIIHCRIKMKTNGASSQLSYGEMYTNNSGTLTISFRDSVSLSDSTINLYAGYVAAGTEIYVRLLSESGVCGSCIDPDPVVDLMIENMTTTCPPAVACDMVMNGGFEQSVSPGCGYDIEDGVACWYTYQNTSDVFRRNCFSNGGINNLGTNTYGMSPVLNSHNGSPNNAVIAYLSERWPNGTYNESTQTLLTTPLVSGHTYSLSCWLYNYAGDINTPGTTIYVNPNYYNCWVTFATAPGYTSSSSSFPNGLNTITDHVILSANTWTQFTHVFTFSGPSHSNLLIGPNMYNNSMDGFINDFDNKALYVAIDDVSIIEITPLTATSKSLCPGQNTTLNASGADTYTWQPGNLTGSAISVTATATPTVFTVTGTYASGCTVTTTATLSIKATPTVAVTTTLTTICAGQSTSLTAVGNVANFNWSPCPSPPCVTYTNPIYPPLVVSPSVSTTYTVTGTNTSTGCTKTETVLITVIQPTTALVATASPSMMCSGQSTTLTANGSTTYTWNPGSLTGSLVVVSPTVTTNYTVSTNSCGTKTAVVTVSIVPQPTVSVTASPTVICSGQSATLTASGATTYVWNTFQVGSPLVVSPTSTTNYVVTGFNGSCSNSVAVTVSVNPTPTLNFNTLPSPTICVGGNIVFSSVTGGTTYTWAPCSSSCNTTTKSFTNVTSNTIYTLSGTGSNGCVGTKTIAITVVPAPTVAVVASPTLICLGQSSTLTASGATGYTWTPGSSTLNPIVVTPTATSVYTVAGKNTGCGTTSTKTVTVTVIPNTAFTAAASSSSNYPLSGASTTLGANATPSGTYTYQWLPAGGTGSVAVITPTDNAVYSCNVTNQCGTTVSTSLCISVQGTLCGVASATSISTQTITSNTTFSNTTVSISGTITVTSGAMLSFLGSTVKMATDARIVVNPVSKIEIKDSKLFSCQGMWYGIEMQANTTQASTITLRDAKIEDAYRAISVDGQNVNYSPYITSTSTTYNKNYYDFYLKASKVSPASYPLSCQSSTMTSQASTNSPGNNLKCSNFYSPTIATRSFAGIYADDVSPLDLYDGSGSWSAIKNKDYGMFLKKASAFVDRFNIVEMQGAEPICVCVALPVGVGIYSTNSRVLDVKSMSTPSITPVNFSNVGYGIITNKTDAVQVLYANFDNPNQFINSSGGQTQYNYGKVGVHSIDAANVLRVKYNTFNQTYTAVSANFSVTASSPSAIVSVNNNTIAAGSGTLNTGVDVSSAIAFTAPLSNLVVAENNISNANVAGIKLTSVTGGLAVSNNTITLRNATTGTRDGIWLNGNNNAVRVDNNSISGNLGAGSASAFNLNCSGIRSVSSPGCKIQCNTITQVGKGVEYSGGNSSPGDGFFGNILNYPIRRGLVLSNGGLIGMQGSNTGSVTGASANQWTGSWPSVNTADPNQTVVGGTNALSLQSDAINSPLWVRNNSTELPTDNHFTTPSVTTQKYNFTTTTFTGTISDYTTCPSASVGARLSNVEENTEDRDEDFVRYIEELLPVSSNSLSPQDKFMLKQFMFNELSKQQSSNLTLLSFYAQQHQNVFGDYYRIDSLLQTGNTSAANNLNAQAETANDITQTQNSYNTLYVNAITAQSDVDNLFTVAQLCPYQYGNAVYQARALLKTMVYTEPEYNDSCYTDQLTARFGYNEDEEPGVSVREGVMAKLYPNPNNGSFALAYDLKQNHEAMLQITDVSGKLVYSHVLDDMNSLLQVNIDDLQSGIYFVQLFNAKGMLWTDKMIISK